MMYWIAKTVQFHQI